MATLNRVWALTGLLLLMGLGMMPHLKAQGCLVYERQLETYFLNYKTDQAIDLRKIESVWERCQQPTEKMNLIYFYFRSAHALYDAQLSAVEAYEDATYYYDLAARDFKVLVSLDRKEKNFVDAYFVRADELEQALHQEADRLRFRAEDRSYGDVAGDPVWRKEIKGPGLNQTGGSRGMDRQEPTLFRKKSYRDGRYVESHGSFGRSQAGSVSRGPAGRDNLRIASSSAAAPDEDFGYVGTVGEINLINYLRHSRGTASTAPVDTDALTSDAGQRRAAPTAEDDLRYERSESYLPQAMDNAWVMDIDAGRGYYTPWLNAREGAALRLAAGDQSPETAILSFGEVVAASTPVQVVRHPAGTYMQVQTERGQRGWVRQDNFVEAGKMAVITQNARGYLNTYTRQDRNAILFVAGELVILESAREDWVQLVSRNMEKRGWISGLDYLSIDELDLRIAMELHAANQENSLFARRARLEAIRSWEGFERSELRPVIEAQIKAATAFHSNR